MGTFELSHKPLPRIRVIDRQRILEPDGLDRFDRVGDLNRRAQVVFPVAMHHDVVIPADRLAAVLESLLDVDQLAGREHAIRRIAREVRLHVGVREPELVAGEARSDVP